VDQPLTPSSDPTGPGGQHHEIDITAMRRVYGDLGIDVIDVPDDPLVAVRRWLGDAVRAGLPEPNAMVLSTASLDGVPSARTVLLKGIDDRGLVFYTNYTSRKARELDANPRAALTLAWVPMARQVRVEGEAVRVERAETEAYFHSRPHGAQLGAWASRQSSELASRAELEARYAELAARWPEGVEVPVPDFWGGYRVIAHEVELWAGRASRLHDRVRYRRTAPGQPWTRDRLAP
jgi:pyridoxamine 5'-phosphate oxidase